MNEIYKNGLTNRELKNIRSIKKQHNSKKYNKLKKFVRIGIAGFLILNSYKCVQSQEITKDQPSYLEQIVMLNEQYSTNQIRAIHEESVYGLGLSECETQCYLY